MEVYGLGKTPQNRDFHAGGSVPWWKSQRCRMMLIPKEQLLMVSVDYDDLP